MFLRVSGNATKKTDYGRFGEHPSSGAIGGFLALIIVSYCIIPIIYSRESLLYTKILESNTATFSEQMKVVRIQKWIKVQLLLPIKPCDNKFKRKSVDQTA